MDELAGVTFGIVQRQPWACITVEGPRALVNMASRPASTILRERIAIYAAPEPDIEASAQAMELLKAEGVTSHERAGWRTRGTFGALIGTALVVGVVSEHDSLWFVGPFALVLAERHPIKPVPATPHAVHAGGIWRLR